MNDVYTHGHHESVLRSHTWRTAENSAGHLIGSLREGMRVLDVGCGPGTITADLGRLVAPGPVLGIDRSEDIVADARQRLEEAPIDRGPAVAGLANVSFATGDVYALDFGEGSFDVVHAHQVLQHLTDPVAALREMRRVLVPGGLLAVRDSDFAGFVWAPTDPLLDRWMALYHDVTRRNDAEADAGRYLPAWVAEAGFEEAAVTSSNWTFASAEDRTWWGGLWADRVRSSSFGEQAVEYGLSDAQELAEIGAAFERWAAAPHGVFVVLHVEVLARR